MVEIYRCIKANINKYIDMVKAQITKEELAIKKDEKNEKRFVLNLCVLINTIDYIKETVNKMNDVIFNLIDEPYNQNLDFSEEEDKCAKVCIEIINSLIKLFENKLETVFTDQMLRVPWEKVENVTSVSGYVHSVNKILKFFSENIKDNINNVYLIRCFKMLSEVTNTKFLEYVYKIRRINQQSVQLLHIGDLTRFYRNQAATLQHRPQQQQRTNIKHLQLGVGAAFGKNSECYQNTRYKQ